jgi:hypothetical protein
MQNEIYNEDKYDPRSLIDDDNIKERIDDNIPISDLEMNVTIELIQNDELDQIPIQYKEDIKIVILKCLIYYADHEM